MGSFILNRMVNQSSLDRTFAALADPTRRAIVNRLTLGDANVGELAEPFAISLPAISKHLRVLESAGLLERHKEGRVHRCRLRAQPLGEAAQWLDETRQFWDRRLEALAQLLDSADDQEPE